MNLSRQTRFVDVYPASFEFISYVQTQKYCKGSGIVNRVFTYCHAIIWTQERHATSSVFSEDRISVVSALVGLICVAGINACEIRSVLCLLSVLG